MQGLGKALPQFCVELTVEIKSVYQKTPEDVFWHPPKAGIFAQTRVRGHHHAQCPPFESPPEKPAHRPLDSVDVRCAENIPDKRPDIEAQSPHGGLNAGPNRDVTRFERGSRAGGIATISSPTDRGTWSSDGRADLVQ
jgi:hypothetical protein